jgi:hypothetical protein
MIFGSFSDSDIYSASSAVEIDFDPSIWGMDWSLFLVSGTTIKPSFQPRFIKIQP